MPTKSHIAFYAQEPEVLGEWQVLLYRHSDGYPEKVLPEIIPFLKNFSNDIENSEYVSARLLQALCNNRDERMDQKDTQIGLETGYGISQGFHSDIEYLYTVYPQAIEVYEVNWMFKPDLQDGCELIKKVDITN